MSGRRTPDAPTEEWKPPFIANGIEHLECPKCDAEDVRVRETETYFDGSDYEAYCGECHARLTVYASVDVTFGNVEVSDDEG